ncbi:(2Fe-2S)-binding protein [Burkholderia anthina]|uniref:(2Fe-2S)-binding protein n=1 Tax=Burkholderia anthina TaxID=179879 RepID=UPI00158B4EB1|nr:(2Fe-2S)-binding protein [Burkholderia anthina]
MHFTLNGQPFDFDGDPATPLLWVIRDSARLTGTKYGCGIGACGACTVHLDGEAARACVLPAASVAGRSVTTIEGLSHDRSHPVQRAWIEKDVPQCGYCQSGMVMAAAALLAQHRTPTDAQIDRAVTNLCRCATYQRIREAIHVAAG